MPRRSVVGVSMYNDYLAGMSIGELAAKYYGEDTPRARARVRSLVSYIRGRVFSLERSIPRSTGLPDYHREILNEEVREFSDFIRVKKKYSNDPFVRQFISHGELIFHLMERLGIKVFSNIGYTILMYHERLWGHVWGYWRDRLRCWRNGRGKTLFSVSPHSLAYVYALLLSIFNIYGYTGKKVQLDYAVHELMGDRYRRRYIEFLEAYRDIGAYIISVVQHPSPPGVLETVHV